MYSHRPSTDGFSLKEIIMKPMFRTLLIAVSLLTCATVQGAPYNRVLPAAVNDKSGNIFAYYARSYLFKRSVGNHVF